MVRELLSKVITAPVLLDVCRIRLDYDEFTLTQPLTAAATQGQCLTDSFTVRYQKKDVIAQPLS
jgi:hypothetical protein